MGFNRRRVALAAATLLMVLLAILTLREQNSEAHAELERSDPAPNEVVGTAPTRIVLIFSQEIDDDGTIIEVFGPDGTQVDLGNTALDLMDLNRNRVTISIRPDAGDGTYTVQWTTLSGEDEEEASGSFTFVVGAANATPDASPVGSPHARNDAAPTSTKSP